MKVFWVTCGHRNGNAGDEVTRDLVSGLARVEVEQAPEALGADLVACGSVAEKIPHEYAGAVWGAGLMFEGSRQYTPQAHVTAVRGRLTRARWEGLPADVAIGDPGLLAADVLHIVRRPPRYRVGLVPHYADAEDPGVREWACRYRDEVVVIDICGRPADVLRAIAECEHVLSSSLHGLIFADSLGVPNDWIQLSDRVCGGSFKFRDYYSAFGISDPLARSFGPSAEPRDIVLGGYQRPGIEGVKRALREAFPCA